MAKSLSSLWLKNMRSMGRAQQAHGRLLQSLLPAVARSPVARRVKKPSKVAKLIGLEVAKRPRVRKALAAKPVKPLKRSSIAALPGVWRKSFFTMPGESQFAPNRRMLYWLYLPSKPVVSGAPAPASIPLVVMLHGCQQTAAEIAASTRMNALAERKGFAVLYPQQSAAADSHRCWHWYKRATQQGDGDVRLIAEMIAQVQRRHGLDTSRTYVAGLSAGAALANILALRHPALIAAVGLHSAPVFGTADSPMSAYRAMQNGSSLAHSDTAHALKRELPGHPGMPVILVHGARDTVVRPVNLEHLTEQFSIINSDAITRDEPVTRRFPARVRGAGPRHAYRTTTWYAGRKPQLVTCEIEGLGHAWSGGDGSVEFSAPEGPDVTLMMWEFFARHHRMHLQAQTLDS